MTMWILWLTIAILLVIAEIFTSSAIAICMAVGAFVAFVAALAGAPSEVQIIVCAVVMVVLLLFVPRLLRRYRRIFQPVNGGESNMDALIGRKGTVENASPDGSTARMRLDGDRWTVRTADGSKLSDGSRVEVLGFDSIILIVKIL